MKPNILVTRHVYPEAIEILSQHGEVEYRDSADGIPAGLMAEAVADKRTIVCQLTDRIDAAVMDAAPELAVIANVAVGFDNIDVAAATERGILVTNTPGVLTDTTADLAFALLMAAARRIPAAGFHCPAGSAGAGTAGQPDALPRGLCLQQQGPRTLRSGCR